MIIVETLIAVGLPASRPLCWRLLRTSTTTKRSACWNQLPNEVEGAEDAGSSPCRVFAGSAAAKAKCTRSEML
jgi:hypothetical protein